MTTKEAKVKDNICECGASVANVNPDQPHETSRQHMKWLDKMTTPDVIAEDAYDKRENLSEDMQEALKIFDNVKEERDLVKRMQKTAKAIRVIYAMEGWSDGIPTPAGIPETVGRCLQVYHIPVLEDPRVMERRKDAADPFRSI